MEQVKNFDSVIEFNNLRLTKQQQDTMIAIILEDIMGCNSLPYDHPSYQAIIQAEKYMKLEYPERNVSIIFPHIGTPLLENSAKKPITIEDVKKILIFVYWNCGGEIPHEEDIKWYQLKLKKINDLTDNIKLLKTKKETTNHLINKIETQALLDIECIEILAFNFFQMFKDMLLNWQIFSIWEQRGWEEGK